MKNNKLNIFKKYPKWVIEDIRKMAERLGPQAYGLVVAKYKISVEEIEKIIKEK